MGDGDHIIFRPAAGRAGDQVRPAAAHVDGLQDAFGGHDLFHRIGGQADPDGIADALTQQSANADGGFQHAHFRRARLGDAQMQGIVRLPGQQGIGLHVGGHMGAFHRQADVVKAAVVQQPYMAHGAVHQRLRRYAAVLFQQRLFQRAAVDADADGDMV